VGPGLIVYAAEALSTARGDRLVFGLEREGEDGRLAALLGPRLGAWQLVAAKVLDGGSV
jgi:hypothetical protein